mgnify:CR=1 FL=1
MIGRTLWVCHTIKWYIHHGKGDNKEDKGPSHGNKLHPWHYLALIIGGSVGLVGVVMWHVLRYKNIEMSRFIKCVDFNQKDN